MAKFYPLYVRRSDGKLETATKARKEKNEPDKDQLDQTPDKNGVADFYREVAADEVKHMDWRRKLGGMLARELNGKEKSGAENSYILVTFPENYRLYEHVKRTEKDGKTEVKSKNHAGGNNDRQDAYLYGHPIGKRKRYRSPGDFFPHLLWLCTDESGDPNNCSCKFCTPEELENAVPGAKVKVEKSAPIATPQSQNRQLVPVIPVSRPASAGSTAATNSTPRPLVPTALPPAKSNEQYIDSQYNKFLHRSGELVWFKRGPAWALGVITRRWEQNNRQYYSIQPLSYPSHHQPPVLVASHQDMRPWLAWSVPAFSNDALNRMPNPPQYETADWAGIINKKFGNGDAEVDASILAAKLIDSTWTPFGLSRSEAKGNVTEKQYDGLFLGAEKLWLGDPIRVISADAMSVNMMVIHHIVEQSKGSQTSISVVGDVYRLNEVAHHDPNVPSPAAPQRNLHLPQRIIEDLAFRNARSISAKRTASYWKIILSQQRIDVNSIKGRWYESSVLLPILQPDYEEVLRRGEIQECSSWMNARGDCVNANRASDLPRLTHTNIRKKDRREALGQAVPPSTQIQEGTNPPTSNNAIQRTPQDDMGIDPRFDTADNADVSGAGSLDEFMNLDGIDGRNDSLPGFGQQYDSQGSGAARYY